MLRLTKRLLFVLAALLASAIFLIGQTDLIRPTPGAYRGSEQCTGCHGATHADTISTHHELSLQGPAGILKTTVSGKRVSIFDPSTPGYDKYVAPYKDYFNESNVLYTIGGHGWMQRFVTRIIPGQGDPTDYSQSVYLSDNDSVIMGIQWNQRQGRWENFHGPTGDKTWTSISFNTKCGGCHSTGFAAKDLGRLERWADKGIMCEACHGPSSEINPVVLESQRSNEVCGSCHTRGISKTDDFEFPWNEKLGGVYQPKKVLSSYIDQITPPSEYLWPDGESKAHHQQWPDFQLSRHATSNVTCTDCHHPHKNEFKGQLRDEPLTVCLYCHATKLLNSSDRYAHSKHTDRQAGCIDCHMPRTAAAIESGDIRSHTFFMIEPQKTREFGIPSGCVDCHTKGAGSPKSQAKLEEAFLEIAPSFRQSTLTAVATTTDRWTGFALANLGQKAARLLFTVFDPDGKIFKSSDIQNPKVLTLGPGKQVAYVVDEFFGGALAGQQGWVRLSHYEPNLKGFYLEGNEAGSELTGLTTEGVLSKMWVTPVLWPGSDNRVGLTNLSSSNASIILTPMDSSGAKVGSSLSGTIPARGRKNFEFQSLFPDLPSGGYLAIESDISLEGQITSLKGKSLATLRLFPAGKGSDSLTIPHAVLDDEWDTRLILYNPMDHDVEVQIQMRRDGSGSLPYGGISRRTLNPGTMLNESLSKFVPVSTSRVEGYLLVKTSSFTDRIQGAVAFTSLRGGALAALSAESKGRKELTFSHVAQGNGYWTGLALLAVGGSSATVELHSEKGDIISSSQVTLSDRRVATLGQLLSVGNVKGGYIQIRAGTDIFAFELFGNDRGSILAAVPPQ